MPLQPYLENVIARERNWRDSYGGKTIDSESLRTFYNAVLDVDEFWDHPSFLHFHPQLSELFRHLMFNGFIKYAEQHSSLSDVLAITVLWNPGSLSFDFEAFEEAWRRQAMKHSSAVTEGGLEMILKEYVQTVNHFAEKFTPATHTIVTEPFEFLVPLEDREWFKELLAYFKIQIANDYAWQRDHQLERKKTA